MSWLPTLLAVALVASSPADTVQQAQRELATRLHEEGRYAEAAALLEGQFGQAGADPHIAFDAGQSRMAAGHRAHAWRDFRAYLDSPGLSPEDRAIGESRLRAAESGTSPVTLTLASHDATAHVSLHRSGVSAQERPPLDAALVGGTAVVRLDPGPWELRAEAVGFLPLVQRVDVGDQPMTIALELKQDAPPAPEPAPAFVQVRPEPDRRAGRAETVAGAVLLPLGLAALGGVVGVAVAHRHTRSEFEPLRAKFEQGLCLSDEVLRLEDLSSSARRQQGAMIGLGVAAGVLIGAGVGLLIHGRTRAKSRVALGVRPGLTGLTLIGKF